MATYVVFDEPFAEVDGETIKVELWVLREDAIRVQKFKARGKYEYASDSDALDDFMVIYWARLVEMPDA